MGAIWLAFKASRYARWAVMAGAAVMAVMVVLRRAEGVGAKKAEAAMKEADNERATEIEDDADETRRRLDAMPDDDVDDWLRNHPSNRDR